MGILIKCPFPHPESFRKGISYQGPARWNELPRTLREVDTPEVFKVELKEYYLEKFLESMVV